MTQDHRRRILEHQQRVAAEQQTPDATSSEPQLKMPLIGEVRRPEAPIPPKRRRPKRKKPIQPQLGEA
jgi:hypothetical protein